MAYQGHEVRTPARPLSPDRYHCCVVAVEEHPPAGPPATPCGAGHQDGVELLPGNGVSGLFRRPVVVEPLASPVRPVPNIGCISEELHVGCGGPVGLEEEACSRPGGEEVLPPGEVGSSCPVQRHMMVQVSRCGRQVNQPPKEDPARRHHLARESQLPDEGEELPFGASAPSSQLADGLVQLCLPLRSDGGRHGGRIQEDAQEGEGGGRPFLLLWFGWGPNGGAEGVHGYHVVFTLLGVTRACGEEIIQVVDDVPDSRAVTQDPFNCLCQLIEEGRGGAQTKW